ncbi:peroxisomal nicotinamide adenine dinucleotide carrier-like isoform X3 [Olea europaea var. sylvestris]|uniref:peroxisomal nicotinamide adenine dinucleotide carrier-like isoform X3 n=1 Tax=Olea europaea var. sylvestris TaxID=158386 RepID=UPI000C1D667C|nr:peroxisomal nicotinamide adenine dinucleotide carrier-like isoform X3 [Olea europaea var. sylvestris]
MPKAASPPVSVGLAFLNATPKEIMSDALINGLAGAGGGIIAQLITYPLQTVNTRQQTDRDPKKEKINLGTVEQMFQVVKQEGWGRLYGGLTPSLVGTAASQDWNSVLDAQKKKKQRIACKVRTFWL